MFRKYILLFPLAVLCPALATVTFPNAGGDLSDFSVFGDKVNEENFLTNNIKIDKAGTYTASKDFTIGGLYVNKADANVVIDMTAAATGADGDRARTINLTGALATDGLNNFTHIQGGTWNMNGKGVRASQGFSKNHNKAKLRITGADINNVGTVAGGYGSTGVEVIIDGASRINTSNLRPDHDRGTSALLVISNGSVVTTASFLGSNGSKLDSSYGYSTKTVVTDEDTSLAVSSSFKFGSSPCAQFFLTKGAYLNVTASAPYIGSDSGNGVNHTNLYFEINV